MKKKIILEILEELDKTNSVLSQEELGTDMEQYGQIFDIMFESHLISVEYVKRVGKEQKYSILENNHPRITLNGIEYLEQSKNNYNRLVAAINNLPSEMGSDKYKLNINQTY
ncbi:YjcQ family protein [Clostridium sp.]